MPEDGEGGDAPRSLADRVLDLIVFAPAGAVLNAVDDWPAMAVKGRERVDQELRNAHMVGRFAVEMGRRQFQSHFDSFLASVQAPRADRPAGGRAGPPTAATSSTQGSAPSEAGVDPMGPPDETTVDGVDAPATVAVDPVVDQALPGYDTLSASQVVRRLDGLGPEELAAVERHEQGGRGRRTILTRARQLLDERAPGAAAN